MKTWSLSSTILLHLRTHLFHHFSGACSMMNRAAPAWKLQLFLWLLWICQAPCPLEMGCGSLKHKVWRLGSNRDYNDQKNLYFCLETWLGLVNFFGPVCRKMRHITVSQLSRQHFMCYLHMRRRLRQQMLQKRESVNIYSDSAQLLISTPPPLSFVSYSWGWVWVGFCLTCTFGTQLWRGVVSALGSRNLVIKSILTCSSRAVKNSTSVREPLTRPEWEKEASCRHPPLNEVYLHEPLMK